MEIENRLKKLETRLSSIEKFIAENFQPRSRAVAATEAAPAKAPPPLTEIAKNNSFKVPNYMPATDSDVKSSIHFVDTHAFNRRNTQNSNYLLMPVAVLGFILVSIFILRFGIDTGWLSPLKQLFLTVLVSVLLIGSGFFYKEMNNEYIRYLPAVGVMLLFLASFGSTCFYHFFPRNVAFLFIGTVGVCSMLMYQEFRHAIYMILAAAGAYVIPLYVANDENITMTNSYFLIISLIFAAVACWQNLRPVYLLGAYLALPISAIADYHDNDLIHKSLFIMAHFLIFTGGMFIHIMRSKQTITKTEAIAFVPAVLLFFVIEYYDIAQINHFAAGLFIFLAALYLGFIYIKVSKIEVVKVEEPDEIQVVEI